MATPPWTPSPIREYGLLGDTRTGALTSKSGSIDRTWWLDG
ncbi:MAG TPA: hypothetical protein VIP57_11100 [Candidatus Dormibacteraeota bacterium]